MILPSEVLWISTLISSPQSHNEHKFKSQNKILVKNVNFKSGRGLFCDGPSCTIKLN